MMFNYLKKALKTGCVTSTYPATAAKVDANFRGKPEHNPQQCIGCAACVNACPSNALNVEVSPVSGELEWSLFLGRCIFCARCEEVCPTAAIVLSQQVEMAVWRREDLFQRARFAACHCRTCGKPFAVQKEIDYVIALLCDNGDSQAESRRGQFETCPACKRQQCLAPASQYELTRHVLAEAL